MSWSKNRVGTQLLMSSELRDRGRALAIVRSEPVAEVWRVLIEARIARMERDESEALEELRTTLLSMDVDYSEALERMVNKRLKLADLFTEDGRIKAELP